MPRIPRLSSTFLRKVPLCVPPIPDVQLGAYKVLFCCVLTFVATGDPPPRFPSHIRFPHRDTYPHCSREHAPRIPTPSTVTLHPFDICRHVGFLPCKAQKRFFVSRPVLCLPYLNLGPNQVGISPM